MNGCTRSRCDSSDMWVIRWLFERGHTPGRAADCGRRRRAEVWFWALSVQIRWLMVGRVKSPPRRRGRPRRSNKGNATLASAWRGRSDRTPSLIFCCKLSEMGRAVQLNGDTAVDEEKVDNVATYAELPPELLSQQASP